MGVIRGQVNVNGLDAFFSKGENRKEFDDILPENIKEWVRFVNQCKQIDEKNALLNTKEGFKSEVERVAVIPEMLSQVSSHEGFMLAYYAPGHPFKKSVFELLASSRYYRIHSDLSQFGINLDNRSTENWAMFVSAVNNYNTVRDLLEGKRIDVRLFLKAIKANIIKDDEYVKIYLLNPSFLDDPTVFEHYKGLSPKIQSTIAKRIDLSKISKASSHTYVAKLGRDKEKVDKDSNTSIYCFIGTVKPREVGVDEDGEPIFKNSLYYENLVKIDQYDPSSHSAARMMMMRARIEMLNFYTLTTTKDLLDDYVGMGSEDVDDYILKTIKQFAVKSS
jgi:hypothetical protein